ncbi:dienelactone hydrolase family protein [Pseudomonas aeruginosa]
MQAATRDADAAKARFLAGLELLKRQPQTDPSQIAAIGYCFGGKIVLDMARQGLPLAGVAVPRAPWKLATPASGRPWRAMSRTILPPKQ